MDILGIVLSVFAVLIVVTMYKCFLRVQENERAVVLRLGKFAEIYGPGLGIVMPQIDRVVMVNLTKHIPDWQSLTEKELQAKVKEIVLNDPDKDYL